MFDVDANAGVQATLERIVTLPRISLLLLHVIALTAACIADVSGFWVDERIAYELITQHTTAELLVAAPQWPPHFPTWFVFVDLIGVEPAMWISRLGHAALIAPTYKLGRWYAGETAGHQAAFFVALSPFLAAQAGWFRMYGILNAALVWALWFGISGQFRRAAGCCTLAALLHPFGAFGGIWLLVTQGRDRLPRRAAVGGSLALLPLGGVFAYVLSQQGLSVGPTGVYHGIAPDLLRLTLTATTTVAGSPHNMVQVGLLLTATAIMLWRRHEPQLAAWILIPIVTLTAVSYGFQPIWRVKYFGFVAPAVAVLAAGYDGDARIRALLGACLGAAMCVAWLQRLTIPAIVARRFIFWF